MAYVFLVLLLFGASVMTHIFFCRKTTRPGLHARVFGLIAIIFLGIDVILILSLQYWGILDPHSLWGLPFKITAGVMYVLLVPIYLCFYVLTQLTSPSKKVLLTISQQGDASYGDILASIQKEDFIMTRLKDLCASGCVTQTDGRYTLTTEGRKIAAVLQMMQGILGRKVGG